MQRLAIPILLVLLGAIASPSPSQQRETGWPPELWPPEVTAAAARLPLQDGGRIKPFASYAGYTLLAMLGNRSAQRGEGVKKIFQKPTAWALDVMLRRGVAVHDRVFLVTDDALLDDIGMGPNDPARVGRKRRDTYSYAELEPHIGTLLAKARRHFGKEDLNRAETQLVNLWRVIRNWQVLVHTFDPLRSSVRIEDDALTGLFEGADSVTAFQVAERAREFSALGRSLRAGGAVKKASFQAWSDLDTEIREVLRPFDYPGLVPWDRPFPGELAAASDRELWATWRSLQVVMIQRLNGAEIPSASWEVVRGFASLAATAHEPAGCARALKEVRSRIDAVSDRRGYGEVDRIDLEVSYHSLNLHWKALYVFLFGFLCAAFAWLPGKASWSRWFRRGTWSLTALGLLLLTGAIVIRCMVRGRPPVTSLYESFLFITWVGVLVALVSERIMPRRIGLCLAPAFGALGLELAHMYEAVDKQDTIAPLQAVLDTNFWLATHVTTIVIGYAAGFVAAIVGTLYLILRGVRVFVKDPVRHGNMGRFNKNLVRMTYGVICFGVLFSIVGTILGGVWANDSWGRFWGWDPKENGALLICLAELGILHARMAGVIRDFGLCMLAAFIGIVVAFSWFHVNLLQVGLHSYGFSEHLHSGLWIYYWIQGGLMGLGALGLLFEWVANRRLVALPADPFRA